MGFNGGVSLTTGVGNCLFGKGAGDAITTGGSNIAVGTAALSTMTASTYGNIGIGENALTTNNGGTGQNTSVGYRGFEALTTAEGCTAVGSFAGLVNTTGNSNSFLGTSAGTANTTGSNNLCLGHAAGAYTTGSNNIAIGTSAAYAGNPGGAITTGSNVISMGNASHGACHIQTDWTVASDKRDKTDVTPLDMGLGFINKLEPVTYKWDKRAKYEEGNTPDGTHKESWTDVGFLAQDVEEIEAEYGHKIDDETNLTTYMSEDKNAYGLTYAKFVPMLVKAVQELTAKVEELEDKLGDK